MYWCIFFTLVHRAHLALVQQPHLLLAHRMVCVLPGGFGVWVWGLGFGAWGLGFGVWVTGFGVQGLVFRFQGLGCGV